MSQSRPSPFVVLLPLILVCALTYNSRSQEMREMVRVDTLQPFILDSVEIQRADVFSTTGRFGNIAAIINSFHWLTKPEVIADELFVTTGDTVYQHDLDEIERNLRALDIFAIVRFEVVPLDGERGKRFPRSDLRVVTRDAWSLGMYANYSISAGEPSYTLGIRETNLFGIASQLGASVSYTDLYDRRWTVGGSYFIPNIAGTHMRFGAAASVSRLDKATSVVVDRPFYSNRTRSAFSVAGSFFEGQEAFHLQGGSSVTTVLADAIHRNAAAWYGGVSGGRDKFHSTVRLFVDRTSLPSAAPFYSAFDNSVGIFGGIGSIRRRYIMMRDVDMTGAYLVPVGAYGSVSIGKVSPISGGLDNVIYLGGEARQAGLFDRKLYLYGSVSAGTGLAGKQPQFTSERIVGTAVYAIDPGALAARLEQSTVWNWPRYYLKTLDRGSNLRGYDQLRLVGDNKLSFNLEYRLFPIFQIPFFKVGAVAFYDMGSVWDQGEKLSSAQFHHSLGFGLRIGSSGGNINTGLLRVDVAYNFDENRISWINIGTREFFDAFGSLEFVPPGPYVP